MNQIRCTWSHLLREVTGSAMIAIRRAVVVPAAPASLLARGMAMLFALLVLPSLAVAQNTTVTLTPAGNPAPPWTWPGAPAGFPSPFLVLSGTSSSPYAITGIAQVNITMTHPYVGEAFIRLEFTPSTGPGAGVPISVEILTALGTTFTAGSVGYPSNLGGSYTFTDPPAGQNTLAIMNAGTNFVLPSGSYRAYGKYSVPTALSTSLTGVVGTGTWRLSFTTSGNNGGGAATVSAASVTFTSGGCPGAWSALGSGASVSAAMAVLPGGDVMVGDVGRYNPTTNVWTPLATRTNASVNALAVTPSGDVIVGGTFTTAGGVAANKIARYNPATGVWSALGTGMNNTVYAVVALPGGDVIAGGTFTSAGGVAVNRIARFNPTTNTWSAMGSGVVGSSSPSGSTVYAMAMLPSGEVVIAGDFFAGNGIAAGGFTRYNPTTGAWISTAGPGISGYVAALTVLPGGDVIAGGAGPVFPPGGGSYLIGRYRPTTNDWTGLGVFTSGIVGSLATLPSGDVVVGGGTLTTAGGVPVNGIGRCNPSSDTWTGLGSGVSSAATPNVYSLVALPGGDVIAAGGYSSAGGVAVPGIARYTFASPAPSISTQPLPQSTCVSGTATFVVAAAGGGPVTYQWQWQPEPTAAWTDLTNGINSYLGQAALDVTGATEATVRPRVIWGLGGNLPFRCIVTSMAGCGSVTSDAATLTVGGPECCLGDYNQDGGIDGSDVSAFFEDWEAGSAAADVNADGGIDGADVSAFFEHWEAGC
ncbi:MAG: hypothetical protein JSR77_03660 [Planctomycetes bacterium]|nr:hypothetical protein [Planctomycetota bacterium]